MVTSVERTNSEWLAELRGPGRAKALADLRELLVRGLQYAMSSREDVNAMDLEDFAQEAVLKVLAGLDSFRGDSKFITWASKIAVNVAFSELRRKRWQDISLQTLLDRYEGDFTPSILIDSDPIPESQLTQKLLLELVQQLIREELTDHQRRAMVAVVFGGMPGAEVARRLGITRNALYKLMHDARLRLKTLLADRGINFQDALAVFDS